MMPPFCSVNAWPSGLVEIAGDRVGIDETSSKLWMCAGPLVPLRQVVEMMPQVIT